MREIDTGWIAHEGARDVGDGGSNGIGDGGSCGVKPVLCIGDGGTKIISREGWGGNSAGDGGTLI
jgi:hypothetical protein